jgi:serine/threonine protein kinase
VSIQFGKYVLQRKLAEGGMAELFLAKQEGMEGFEKLVVVKRILPQLCADDSFVRMFLNEARVAARLNHPNVVQIFDLGKLGEQFFIAMEYVHGEDLRAVIREATEHGARLPLGLCCRILADAMAGLHYAHTRAGADGKPLGLVHRDVSPQNVIVTYEGGVKIVDFGIAKATREANAAQTQAGLLKGKYAYMSPEQARGLPIDARADVFCAGILLWEMVTWQRLFKRPTEMATLMAVAEEPIRAPRTIDKTMPVELDRIICKALERNPDDRFQSAQELRAALEALIRTSGWEADAMALSEWMRGLFATKLRRQAEDIRAAGLASLEDFLLKVEEKTSLSWMGPPPATSRRTPSSGLPTSRPVSGPMAVVELPPAATKTPTPAPTPSAKAAAPLARITPARTPPPPTRTPPPPTKTPPPPTTPSAMSAAMSAAFASAALPGHPAGGASSPSTASGAGAAGSTGAGTPSSTGAGAGASPGAGGATPWTAGASPPGAAGSLPPGSHGMPAAGGGAAGAGNNSTPALAGTGASTAGSSAQAAIGAPSAAPGAMTPSPMTRSSPITLTPAMAATSPAMAAVNPELYHDRPTEHVAASYDDGPTSKASEEMLAAARASAPPPAAPPPLAEFADDGATVPGGGLLTSPTTGSIARPRGAGLPPEGQRFGAEKSTLKHPAWAEPKTPPLKRVLVAASAALAVAVVALIALWPAAEAPSPASSPAPSPAPSIDTTTPATASGAATPAPTGTTPSSAAAPTAAATNAAASGASAPASGAATHTPGAPASGAATHSPGAAAAAGGAAAGTRPLAMSPTAGSAASPAMPAASPSPAGASGASATHGAAEHTAVATYPSAAEAPEPAVAAGTAMLVIHTDAPANITVDGKAQPLGTSATVSVQPGIEHVVTVQRPGHSLRRLHVPALAPGERMPLHFNLR